MNKRFTQTKKQSPNEGVETEPTQFGFLFRKPAHRNTVAMREKRPLCRDIFEVVECFETGAGNNLRYFCHGCDKFNRVTTITIMLHHLEQCPLSNVSNNEDRARMRVRMMPSKFTSLNTVVTVKQQKRVDQLRMKVLALGLKTTMIEGSFTRRRSHDTFLRRMSQC